MHSPRHLLLSAFSALLAGIAALLLIPTEHPVAASSESRDPAPLLSTEYLPVEGEIWNIRGAAPADVEGLWYEGCPVGVDELSLLTLTHHDYHGGISVGTLLVNDRIAQESLTAFQELYRQGFQIEHIDHRPGGGPEGSEYGSTTAGYVCRTKVTGSSWSEHAHGTAIDVNPNENPMVKNGQLIAGSEEYIDRAHHRPGMVTAESPAVRAFTKQGLSWGGEWKSSKDWMHFSEGGT